MHGHLRTLAGEGATDCGRVPLGEESTAANNCALEGLQRKHPFIVRYDVQGLDSQLVVGLAANTQGQVVVVKYDSEGWDPRDLRPADKLADDNHVLINPCPVPTEIRKTKLGYLSCFE